MPKILSHKQKPNKTKQNKQTNKQTIRTDKKPKKVFDLQQILT